MKIKYIVLSCCLVGLQQMVMAMGSSAPQQKNSVSFYITQLEKLDEPEASHLFCCPFSWAAKPNEKMLKIEQDLFDLVKAGERVNLLHPEHVDTTRMAKIKKVEFNRLATFVENHRGTTPGMSLKELCLTGLVCSTCVAAIRQSDTKLVEHITLGDIALGCVDLYLARLKRTGCPLLEGYCKIVEGHPELIEKSSKKKLN